MSRFKQAPPDPEKAARDGVSNYVPARRQPNLAHKCACGRTATWDIKTGGEQIYACADCRMDHVLRPSTDYVEKRL